MDQKITLNIKETLSATNIIKKQKKGKAKPPEIQTSFEKATRESALRQRHISEIHPWRLARSPQNI